MMTKKKAGKKFHKGQGDLMSKKHIDALSKRIHERQKIQWLGIAPSRRGKATNLVARQFKHVPRDLQGDPMRVGYYRGTYDTLLALDVLMEDPLHVTLEYLNDMRDECEQFFAEHRTSTRPKQARKKRS